MALFARACAACCIRPTPGAPESFVESKLSSAHKPPQSINGHHHHREQCETVNEPPSVRSGIQRLRTLRGKVCTLCGCSASDAHGCWAESQWYHKSCLRCGRCHRSLLGVSFGKIAPSDDVLYCDELTRSCLSRLVSEPVQADAKEAENQRLSEAEVYTVGRAKVHAVDHIGDELDKIVQRMMPRCARCGKPFDASDHLVIQGMVKFHISCSQTRAHVSMTPKAALENAPCRLLFKIVGDKTITFFAAKTSTGIYEPDESSRTPRRRRFTPIHSAFVRVVSTTGTDLAQPAALVSSEFCFRARFEWQAHELRWEFTAIFDFEAEDSTISFLRAALSVDRQLAKTELPPTLDTKVT